MKSHINTALVIMSILVTTGCAEFDRSAIPLYDELLVAPPEEYNDPRRAPHKNPLVMPPGYKKPDFNHYPGDKDARNFDDGARKAMQLVESQNDVEYPALSSVPGRPNTTTASGMKQSHQNLAAEKQRAESIQQKILQGQPVTQKMLTDTRPPELPAKGDVASMPWNNEHENPAGLRESVTPITFVGVDGKQQQIMKQPDGEQIKVTSTAPSHEFGNPSLLENGEHSSVTHMYDVGYESEDEKARDDEQFRLKPFEYKNVPNINDGKQRDGTAVSLVNVQAPPQFLPESRYKARRLNSPVYEGTYNGRTYFMNEH